MSDQRKPIPVINLAERLVELGRPRAAGPKNCGNCLWIKLNSHRKNSTGHCEQGLKPDTWSINRKDVKRDSKPCSSHTRSNKTSREAAKRNMVDRATKGYKQNTTPHWMGKAGK